MAESVPDYIVIVRGRKNRENSVKNTKGGS